MKGQRYLFPPKRNDPIGQYVYWENGFSEEEIEKIIKLGESRNPLQAQVGGGEFGRIVREIRISNISWIDLQKDSVWLYDKLCDIILRLNNNFYNFDLNGFYENMQFTVYEGNEEGYYDWHLDAGTETISPRKLSFVLQLTDPKEYEGGELQLMTSVTPLTIKKEKGFAVAFPSYTLHRVTPVTKGVRKTLVVWVTGPSFR